MEPTQCITSHKDDRRSTGMAAGMVCLALLSTPASAASAVAPDVKAQAQANYGKLPLSFEVNQGQTDAQVKLLARGQGYTLFLTPTEAVLSLKEPQAKAEASPSSTRSSSAASETIGTVLRMRLIGANSAPKIVGKEPLPGRVNYLIGKAPGKWHTQVPIYGKVAYEGVYPGVDLVYYGNQGQLEYDFVVSPGADPQQIELAFQGADNIGLNPAGELVLHAQKGGIRMHKPVIYQEIDGIRKPIDGGYVFKADRTVGFQVSAYDAARPLIIDPILVYSTYLGGSDYDDVASIAVVQGRVYVAGVTLSSDFPTLNALQPIMIGDRHEAFVAQFTADGMALGYVTYLGGSGDEVGISMAVDLWGQVTVAGCTYSSDFPTHNALQSASRGAGIDGFVAQLTADGSALRYSTYLGGSGQEEVRDVAVDLWGQATVTGYTYSSDFPTHNALQPASGGNRDAFVAQLTADGRALRYSTYLGGSLDDGGGGIAVDLQGRAYVTGYTSSTDFPTHNALQPASGGQSDGFVAQLTADGRALRYSTYLGGSVYDGGDGIAVDLHGQVYVVGYTQSSDFPTLNALQPALDGVSDAFIIKIRSDDLP